MYDHVSALKVPPYCTYIRSASFASHRINATALFKHIKELRVEPERLKYWPTYNTSHHALGKEILPEFERILVVARTYRLQQVEVVPLLVH